MDFSASRIRLLPAEALALRERGLVSEDSHRRRPRYFDGRFLAARDLTREQAYFLARQAAYARALGPGVVEGLQVTRGARGDELRVSPGLGYTPAGELVSLQQGLTARLADMPALQALNTRLRQDRLRRPPLRNRSGVFALVLRPLEFTANPVGAYPQGLEGPRTVEPGDIVEASSLELVPLNEGSAAQLDAARRSLERLLFAEQGEPALPPEVLPLAVVALQGDQLRWIDEGLLRRQAGQAHADVLGFGFAPRGLREAHLAQYRARLAELAGRRFAASECFDLLPPAGPLPAGVVEAGDFSQRFFPAGYETELSLLPEDELPALVERSLLLPPLDLTQPAAASVRLSLLIPVPRAQLPALLAELSGQLTRRPPPRASLPPLKRLPAERLQALLNPFPLRVAFDPAAAVDATWRRLLAAAEGRLWYARLPNLPLHEAVLGRPVRLGTVEIDREELLNRRLRDFGQLTRFRELSAKADVFTRGELVNLLSAEALSSPLLMGDALSRLEAAAPEKLDAASLAGAQAEINRPGAGAGLARLAELQPELLADKQTLGKLLADGRVAELDQQLASGNQAELQRVAEALKLASTGTRIDLGTVLRRPGG